MDKAQAVAPRKEARIHHLITEMENFLDDENMTLVIEVLEQALTIRDSEKLRRKLTKIKQLLQEVDEEAGTDMVDMGDGFYVAKSTEQKLYPYQKDGIRWLWSLFLKGKGGVLGDDSGLGKTFQVIAFLSGLFDLEKISSVLVVMTAGLLTNWKREFDKWAPDMNVVKFHGKGGQHEEHITKVQKHGGVLLTTYKLITTKLDRLSNYQGQPFTWDYVILDEGDMIKNPSKRTTAVNYMPSKNRIVLTGTPVENKPMGLWSIFNFAHQGSLLGHAATFKQKFSDPITKARKKDSTKWEKKLGDEASNLVRKRIEPYYLRREMNQVLNNSSSIKLPTKTDFAVWVGLRPVQVDIYRKFLASNSVSKILKTTKSPLGQIKTLKTLCDHPRLLSAAACKELQLSGFLSTDGNEVLWEHLKDHELIGESGKLEFLIKLLNDLKTNGHRTVVFSQSRVMLNIIKRILTTQGFGILKIDGSVVPGKRLGVIESFQQDKTYQVLLLTSQVGSVGIDVTAADRVVIYDPSWNPAADSKAVDRVHRVGQKRHVIVYRLLTCATVEEKIYRRVFQQSFHKQAVEAAKDPFSCITNQERRDMLVLDDPTISKTKIRLEMHSASRVTSEDTDAHIAFLYSLGIVDLGDHDLLVTVPPDEDTDLHDIDEKDIGDHISRAIKLLDIDCEVAIPARTQTGACVAPFAVEDKSKPRLGASTAGLKPTQILERRDVRSISSGLQQLYPVSEKHSGTRSPSMGSVARGVKMRVKNQVGEPPEEGVVTIDLSKTLVESLPVEQQIKMELGNGSLLAQMPVGSRQAKMELGSESALSQTSVCSRLEKSDAEQGSMSSSTQSWKRNSSASNFSCDLNKLNGSERVNSKSEETESINIKLDGSERAERKSRGVSLLADSSQVCESDSILVEDTPEKPSSQAARVSGASFAPRWEDTIVIDDDDDLEVDCILDFKSPEPKRRGQDSFVKGNRSLIPESDSATDGSSDKVDELPDLVTVVAEEWTACIPDFTPGSRAKRIEASKRRRSSMIVKFATSLILESDDDEEEEKADGSPTGKDQADSNQESEDKFDSDTSDGD